MPRPVVLTCMFVVRMCFLALVTASLLQEESSTLHHEEALAEAARRNGTEELGGTKTQGLWFRHHAAEPQLGELVSACRVDGEAENKMLDPVLTGQLTSGDLAPKTSIKHVWLLQRGAEAATLQT